MRFNIKIEKLMVAFLLSSITYSTQTFAVPASPEPFTIEQPNGNKFIGKVLGDEFLSRYENINGYSIIQNKETKIWYYAINDQKTGELIETKYRADIDLDLAEYTNLQAKNKSVLPHKHARTGEKTLLQAKKRKNRFSQGQLLNKISPIGQFNIPIVIVNFAGSSSVGLNQHFQNIVSGTNGLDTYFNEASFGRFRVGTGTNGVMQVSLPNPITTYATDNGTNLDTGMNQLFTDVGNALNRQNIDLSRYDSDNDGSVDELVLVAAGSRDQATGGVANSTFWSINYPRNFLTPYNIGNGSNTKRVDKMIMLSEFTGPSFRTRIGVFAHELMHTFNMPDLYDLVDTTLTIPPRVRDDGIGNWGLMGGGNWLPNGQGTQPVHPSAYIKSKLGWINTERKITHGIGSPNRPENLTFSPFIGNRQGNVRKCSSRANSKEYFLMENRTRTSGFFERQLPGEGLLVWHINENEPDNKSGRGNDSRLVTLEQADGNNNLGQPLGAPQSNTGDQSDPFPGSLVISTLTRNGIQNPSTDYYSGQDSGFSLVNINRNNLNRNITATYSCKSFNFIWLLPLTLIATFRRRNTTNQ